MNKFKNDYVFADLTEDLEKSTRNTLDLFSDFFIYPEDGSEQSSVGKKAQSHSSNHTIVKLVFCVDAGEKDIIDDNSSQWFGIYSLVAQQWQRREGKTL